MMRYKAKKHRSNKEKREGDRDRKRQSPEWEKEEREPVRKDETIRDLRLEQYWTVLNQFKNFYF